jgi:phosphonoacetate hydrolase
VHLKTPRDADRVAAIIETLPGIEAVLSRQEAARKFRQMASRIGELVVLGDRNTVFGGLDTEMESLPLEYRSHGSTSEAKVPVYIHNAERAPDPGFFRANVDLTRWLFRS